MQRPAPWEGAGIVVDQAYWPVLVEVMPEAFPNRDEAIDAWIAHVDGLIARHHQPFVMLIDTLPVKVAANAHSRKRMSEWLSESEPFQKYCLGVVYLVSSAPVRGVLTAIHWLSRPRPPRAVMGSWEAGVRWCVDVLEEAHIDPPIELPGLYAYRRAS